jgi:hypothetical protein
MPNNVFMNALATFVLAVCGSGGSDTAALIVVILILAAWGLGVWAIIWKGTESQERALLLFLLLASAPIATLMFLGPEGLTGDGDYLARFLLAVLLPTGIGLALALLTRRVNPGRAIAVAFSGAVLIPGGIFVLFFASLGIGTGCLD